jgi:hypothetical protein
MGLHIRDHKAHDGVMVHHTITWFTCDAKRDFGRWLTKWNPKFEFLREFCENFKPNRQGMVQTSFVM